MSRLTPINYSCKTSAPPDNSMATIVVDAWNQCFKNRFFSRTGLMAGSGSTGLMHFFIFHFSAYIYIENKILMLKVK